MEGSGMDISKLHVTITYEPWFIGLVNISKDYLYQEFIRGTISPEDASACLSYTVEAGAKLGVRVK
jgi:hypothetical protein